MHTIQLIRLCFNFAKKQKNRNDDSLDLEHARTAYIQQIVIGMSRAQGVHIGIRFCFLSSV